MSSRPPPTDRRLAALVVAAAVAGCQSSGRGAPAAPLPTAAATASTPDAGRGPGGREAYDRGLALALAGDLPGARTMFERAVELDPDLAIAWFDLGGLREQLGDAGGARAAMERCVAVAPAFAQCRVELASLHHDPDRAMEQLRLALTEPRPFNPAPDRYPAARTRGEALHQAAVTYGMLGFPGATASIAQSALVDPDAEADPRTPRVASHAAASLEREDGWWALRTSARRDADAGQLAAAADGYERVAAAARRLPLERWLDATYEWAVVEVRRGRLEVALGLLDELMWLELITRHADDQVGEQRRSARARTDAALAPLRAQAAFADLLARYRVP